MVRHGIDAWRLLNRPGARQGTTLIHCSGRRNRLNHFARRQLKYKKAFSLRIAACLQSAFQKKIEAKNRLSIIYSADATTLAPKMFGVFTYRTAMLNKAFRDALSGSLRYVYLHRTFIDNLPRLPANSALKTFVLHEDLRSGGYAAALNAKVNKYLELVGKDMKTKRGKNRPDYCYFLDARAFWGSVEPLEYTPAVDSGFLVDAADSLNYTSAAIVYELYRILSILAYVSIKRV